MGTGCPVSQLQPGAVPAALPGFSDSSRVPGAVAWMGDNRFAAVLFYADGPDPRMRAGGQMNATRSTKIFWWSASGGTRLVIHGREAATGRTFNQAVDGLGAGQFPSVPVIPGPGCWTLTEDVDGSTVDSITVPVLPAL